MSSFSMFGTCQGCGLTQYMQGQPCRDCGGHVQQGGAVPIRQCLAQQAIRQQLVAAVMERHTAFLDRAVHDCLSRLGLTLTEAVLRLTRHVGPSWEELYLDGERVLRLDWEYVGERGFCMTRKFHGPAELPAT